MAPAAEHDDVLGDVITPGYTALCLAVPPAVIEAAVARTGPSGLVIVCNVVPISVQTQVAFLRCAPGALPLLSHSIDGAIAGAAIVDDDAALAELRRVLAPGGMLALLPAPAGDAPSRDLRAMLVALGFAIADARTANAIIAAVPPWTGAAGRQRA